MTAADSRIGPLLARLEGDPMTPKGVVDDIRQAVSESPFLSNLLAKAVVDKRIKDLQVSTNKRTGSCFDHEHQGSQHQRGGVLWKTEQT